MCIRDSLYAGHLLRFLSAAGAGVQHVVALALHVVTALGQTQIAMGHAHPIALRLQVVARGLGTVSYTHLDVYKRQTYNWRVSVIELDEVYDISGLPNTAFYVGIRFTAQA